MMMAWLELPFLGGGLLWLMLLAPISVWTIGALLGHCAQETL